MYSLNENIYYDFINKNTKYSFPKSSLEMYMYPRFWTLIGLNANKDEIIYQGT